MIGRPPTFGYRLIENRILANVLPRAKRILARVKPWHKCQANWMYTPEELERKREYRRKWIAAYRRNLK